MLRWACLTARRYSQKSGYFQPNSINKELILSVLNSTATKREAQTYLKKYGESSIRNHCLLMVRELVTQTPEKLDRFAITVKRMQMLGVKPIFMLYPYQDVERQAEMLESCLNNNGVRSIILPDALTRLVDGNYRSLVEYGAFCGLVPIIRPRIFDQKTCISSTATDIPELMGNFTAQTDCRIDKVVLLSPSGGISSGERHDNAHVFINLSQEFDRLTRSLTEDVESTRLRLVQGIESPADTLAPVSSLDKLQKTMKRYQEHLEDLQIVNRVLTRLPSTSTGLITDLSAASNLTRNNPLLYNVLTDRSLISSSLPRFKKSPTTNLSWYETVDGTNCDGESKDAALSTTVVKKGVNIKIYDYQTLTEHNSIGFPGAKPQDENSDAIAKVDLTKLKLIIEKSFGRELDLEHYLDRINGRIASIIVIGDYGGIAILTYEGPEEETFPYLDKFAVLPHLKGSLGISDVIFNLMFQKYPHELVWRSRKDNLVNKWYFQRSVGVLDLAIDLGNGDLQPSMFKLFFHGDDDHQRFFSNKDRLKTYAKYVRDIRPSWKG
ncbi:LADA_0H12530g1_1 [Lachancea dasiensis]|uniref:Amino-acid acetyltransferase, mitochondrial n=1 Tax=Lachancea dasiensis TaxID=1072105 RepID=A0A1G4K3T5_9SACH|nr:LADA_0H12530g1_1 [Lachancea dasiensis]